MKNLNTSKALFLLIIMIVLIIISVAYFFNHDTALLILPILITITFSIPFFIIKKIDLFSIWSFLFYSVVFGVFFRSLYINMDYPSVGKIDQIFLNGETKYFLLPSMFLMLILQLHKDF